MSIVPVDFSVTECGIKQDFLGFRAIYASCVSHKDGYIFFAGRMDGMRQAYIYVIDFSLKLVAFLTFFITNECSRVAVDDSADDDSYLHIFPNNGYVYTPGGRPIESDKNNGIHCIHYKRKGKINFTGSRCEVIRREQIPVFKQIEIVNTRLLSCGWDSDGLFDTKYLTLRHGNMADFIYAFGKDFRGEFNFLQCRDLRGVPHSFTYNRKNNIVYVLFQKRGGLTVVGYDSERRAIRYVSKVMDCPKREIEYAQITIDASGFIWVLWKKTTIPVPYLDVFSSDLKTNHTVCFVDRIASIFPIMDKDCGVIYVTNNTPTGNSIFKRLNVSFTMHVPLLRDFCISRLKTDGQIIPAYLLSDYT